MSDKIMVPSDGIELDGVREYAEGAPVELRLRGGRLVVYATNEGGYNCTDVDLEDLVRAIDKLASISHDERTFVAAWHAAFPALIHALRKAEVTDPKG